MQRTAGASQQLGAAIQLEQVVGVSPVGCAAPARHHTPVPEPAEVIGNEILRQLQPRAELADAPIAVRQLDQQPPPDWVAREPKKARRSRPCRRHVNGHPRDDTSNRIDAFLELKLIVNLGYGGRVLSASTPIIK
jgi:hypothetical protein